MNWWWWPPEWPLVDKCRKGLPSFNQRSIAQAKTAVVTQNEDPSLMAPRGNSLRIISIIIISIIIITITVIYIYKYIYICLYLQRWAVGVANAALLCWTSFSTKLPSDRATINELFVKQITKHAAMWKAVGRRTITLPDVSVRRDLIGTG